MGGRPSRNQKVLQNLKLVRSLIVAKYGPRGARDEDLYQAGLIGLCLAADSFEANRVQGRFSAYARVCIISELSKYALASGGRLLPHRQFYERISIQRHIDDVSHVLGREPSTAEIVESWSGSRAPTRGAVERALRPDPIVMTESVIDVDDDHEFFGEHDSMDIEALLDAKRRFERLPPEDQARLTRGARG